MKTQTNRKKKTYKKTTTMKVKMNTRIRKVVKSMSETKEINAVSLNNDCNTGDVTTIPYYIRLTPIITQGSAANLRIGNHILVSSAYIDGYINLKPYDAISNPFPSIKVKLFLVSQRRINSTTTNSQALTASDLGGFFESSGASFPFQGSLADCILPINNSNWKVHKTKVLSLSLSGASTSYPDATGPHEGSSKYQSYFKFYFGKALGNLKYDDTTGSNCPTNRNLWLIVQPVRTDGGLGSGINKPVEIHYNLNIKFKDM